MRRKEDNRQEKEKKNLDEKRPYDHRPETVEMIHWHDEIIEEQKNVEESHRQDQIAKEDKTQRGRKRKSRCIRHPSIHPPTHKIIEHYPSNQSRHILTPTLILQWWINNQDSCISSNHHNGNNHVVIWVSSASISSVQCMCTVVGVLVGTAVGRDDTVTEVGLYVGDDVEALPFT